MKYGLEKESKLPESKKLWKNAMENEIKFLKFEVFLLKDQLKDVLKTVKLLKEINTTDPPFSSTGSGEKAIPFYQNGNNNNKNDFTLEISGGVGLNNDHRISLKTQVGPTKDTSFDFENKSNPFCQNVNSNMKKDDIHIEISRTIGLNNDHRTPFKIPSRPAKDSPLDFEKKYNPFCQNVNSNMKKDDLHIEFLRTISSNNDHRTPFKISSRPAKDSTLDFEKKSNPFCQNVNSNMKKDDLHIEISRTIGLNNDHRTPFKISSRPAKDSLLDSGEKINLFCQNVNNNDIKKSDFPFKTSRGDGVINDSRIFFKSPAWPIAHPTFGPYPLTGGTRKTRYRITPFVEQFSESKVINTNLLCITAMPEYINWSLEELRMEDYSVARPLHHIQFVNYGLKDSICGLTGTVIERYNPTWGYDVVHKDGRSSKVTTSHQCITSLPEYANKSFEELRLEDYILKPMKFPSPKQYTDIKPRSARAVRRLRLVWRGRLEQNKSVKKLPVGSSWSAPLETKTVLPDLTTKTQSGLWNIFNKAETPPNILNSLNPVGKIDCCKSQKHEKLLGDVFLALRKVTTNLSSINSCLSTMDSNVSEMSSRVSVMDSRLAAVDMFVTMNRFNEKWQSLESKLTSLESPSLTNNTESLLTEEGNTKSTSTDEGLALTDENFKPSSVERPSSTASSTTKTDLNQLLHSKSFDSMLYKPDKNHLKLNLSNDSPKKMDVLQLNTSLSSAVKSVKTSNENVVEKDQLKGTSVENSSFLVNKSDQNVFDESDITNETAISSNRSEENCQEVALSDKFENIVERTSMKKLALLHIEELNNKSTGFSKSEVVSEQETSAVTEKKDLNSEESLSDTENEYFMVDKAELVDISDQCVEKNELCSATSEPSSSENKDIKIFKDITEYLEVKKGKKKDLVYEFGFEAKPDVSVSDTSTQDNTNKDGSLNTSGNIVKEDSFLTFMNNVIENYSIKPGSQFALAKRVFKSRKGKQIIDK